VPASCNIREARAFNPEIKVIKECDRNDLMNSLEQILTDTPDVKSFNRWIKASKTSPKEVEKQLLAQPNHIYQTIGMDWLLTHSKPENLLPFLELLFARRPRPEFLFLWSEALQAGLKKDKRGKLLALLLRHSWQSENWIMALCHVIRANRNLFKETTDLLPAILCRKEKAVFAADFVNALFDSVISAEGDEREFFSVELARLGTGILRADRRTQISEDVLAIVQKKTREICNLTKNQDLKSRTWILDNLNEESKPAAGKICITSQGARYIALAFEKADQGFPAKEILGITARNLGLIAIGKKGDTTIYNPLQHEDIVGGLLPGQTVLIEDEGWMLNQETVVRAKVKRLKNNV
jgi:hypothetical protein